MLADLTNSNVTLPTCRCSSESVRVLENKLNSFSNIAYEFLLQPMRFEMENYGKGSMNPFEVPQIVAKIVRRSGRQLLRFQHVSVTKNEFLTRTLNRLARSDVFSPLFRRNIHSLYSSTHAYDEYLEFSIIFGMYSTGVEND